METPAAYHLAEHARRLSSLLRVGPVVEVDPAAARARVDLGDGCVSAFLPWVCTRASAGGFTTWVAPQVGEQVLVVAPGGDTAAAVILGSLYSTAAPPPDSTPDRATLTAADGAVIRYDAAAHRLEATLPAGAAVAVTAPGSVEILSPQIRLTGHVTLTGDLSVSGRITSTGDQVAAGVSQAGHTHSGIERGNGDTDPPNPGGGA